MTLMVGFLSVCLVLVFLLQSSGYLARQVSRAYFLAKLEYNKEFFRIMDQQQDQAGEQ